MKKILLLTLLVSSFAFGQEVKMKKGVITVDDKEWAKYEGCGLFDSDCSIFKGDQEVNLFLHRIKDPNERRPSNPEGSVSWYEVKLLGTKQSFEIQDTSKSIAKILYKSKVFNEDDTFNEEAIQRLVEKYGMPFSYQYNKSNPNQTIIINQEQKQQQPESGINIKIGGGKIRL